MRRSWTIAACECRACLYGPHHACLLDSHHLGDPDSGGLLGCVQRQYVQSSYCSAYLPRDSGANTSSRPNSFGLGPQVSSCNCLPLVAVKLITKLCAYGTYSYIVSHVVLHVSRHRDCEQRHTVCLQCEGLHQANRSGISKTIVVAEAVSRSLFGKQDASFATGVP